SRVHITVPRHARLRRQHPKWIVIHRGELRPTDVTAHEGLPVTSIEKTVVDVLTETGRLELVRQAITDARREGYISAAEASCEQTGAQLRNHARSERAVTAVSAKRIERLEKTLARVAREQGLAQE